MSNSHILTGTIVSGKRQASYFTQLDWVQEQCQEKLGFKPFPGTLNIEIDKNCLPIIEALEEETCAELIPLDPQFCSAKIFPISIEKVDGAIIIPAENVNIHEKNIREIMAPVNLKSELGLEDGDTLRFSLKTMDEEIDNLKDKLARACRILEMTGLIDFSGHISARSPGRDTFFINPRQASRAEVSPDDLAEVSLQGEWVGGKLDPPQEMPIHAAVFQKREDVNSVAHIHCHYAILPSIAGIDLVPVCNHGSIFGAVVPVYGEAEKITSFKEAHAMAKVLGKSRALIMKGHGAVIAESSVEGNFVACLHLEENARLLVEASILGKPIPLSPEQIKRAAAKTFLPNVSIKKTWSYYLEKGKKAGVFWD